MPDLLGIYVVLVQLVQFLGNFFKFIILYRRELPFFCIKSLSQVNFAAFTSIYFSFFISACAACGGMTRSRRAGGSGLSSREK